MKTPVRIFAVAAVLTAAFGSQALRQGLDGLNDPGDILIADQFNNRVIQIDRHHHVVWSFGTGNTAGPHSIIAPNDCERVGAYTLIAGTGTTAVPDNRVILVGPHGKIAWQYGRAGVAGAGENQLNTPVCAVWLPNLDVLITDQLNERVIEVNLENDIVWQYGTTGVSGAGANQLNNPNSAELLENGHILIADENNNRVIEVRRDHSIAWSYGKVNDTSILNGAAFASRLDGGNTLITDSFNNRIVEVNHDGGVVWTYVTNARMGSVAQPNPTRAVRLHDGHTLISDQFNDQVIEVDHAGNVVFSLGHIGIGDNAPGDLNAPYDAKQIGDYTGLTPPFGWH